jgi:hypothetical protein
MEYKKSELRNNHMSLLRRAQRIQDKIPKVQSRILLPSEMNETFKLGSSGFTTESDEFTVMTLGECKKTKIGLYDRRGKR